jgi:hypothetical protein
VHILYTMSLLSFGQFIIKANTPGYAWQQIENRNFISIYNTYLLLVITEINSYVIMKYISKVNATIMLMGTASVV